MTGIAEMFLALNGADRYEMQLELWCFGRAVMRSEYLKDWRTQRREHVRAYDRARRPLKPKRVKTADMCRDCYALRVPGRTSCAEHLAKTRARAATSGKRAA